MLLCGASTLRAAAGSRRLSGRRGSSGHNSRALLASSSCLASPAAGPTAPGSLPPARARALSARAMSRKNNLSRRKNQNDFDKQSARCDAA
jgi:hypothetical protein